MKIYFNDMIFKIIIIIWLLLLPCISPFKKYLKKRAKKREIVKLLIESYTVKKECIQTFDTIRNLEKRIQESPLNDLDKAALILSSNENVLKLENSIIKNDRAITILKRLLSETTKSKKKKKRLEKYIIKMENKFLHF